MSSSSPRDRHKQALHRPSIASAKPQIGSYRILEVIGKGGMGTVYKAVHTELDRVVALKVLPTKYASNPVLLKRFQREATSASLLHHPNIVAIYDQGESGGNYYLVLEYVDGQDLHSLLSKRVRLAPRRCVEIIKQAVQALAHAHAKGIVHRDIKPSNLLMRRDGTVKLADLGLVSLADSAEESQVTRAGTTVGTVDYMAPEQARDSQLADARSDIYSLGCTLYHMLTGQPPFPEGGIPEKLLSHAKQQPRDVQQLNPEVPDELAAVLNRMMAKDPTARYQSAQELLDELEHLTLRRGPATRNELASLTEALEDEQAEEEVAVPVRRTRPTAPEDETPAPTGSARRTRRPRREPRRTKREPRGKRSGGGLLSSTQWMYVAGGVGAALLIGLLVYVGVNSRDVTSPAGSLKRDLPLPPAPVAGNAAPAPPGEAPSGSPEFPEFGYVDSHGESDSATSKPEPAPAALSDALPRDQFLPSWYEAKPGDVPTRTLRLRRWASPASSGESFADLQAACDALKPDETVAIEIADQGPFFLRDVTIAKAKKLILRAAPGYTPLLVFDPTALSGGAAETESDTDAAPHALLNATGVELELEGLHLAAIVDGTTPAGPIALVRGDRHVSVRRCTFTVAQDTRFRSAGSPAGESQPVVGFGEIITAEKKATPTAAEPTGARQFAAAFSAVCVGRNPEPAPSAAPSLDGAGAAASDAASTSQEVPVRVLMESCFVRGGAMSALSVETPAADVLLRNTLVASGAGPALQVVSTSAAKADDKITLRVVSSTLVSERNGILLAHEGAGSAPAARVHVLDSIVSHPRVGKPGELLLADRWQVADSSAGVSGVSWQSRNSRYFGWGKLAAQTRPLRALAQTADEWSGLWGVRQPEVKFAVDGWPEKAITAPGAVMPQELEYSGTEGTPSSPAQTAFVEEASAQRDGEVQPIGCPLDALPAVPATLHERAFVPFASPEVPELARGDGQVPPIRIDLSDPEVDLAKELHRAQWDEQQTILVRGSGRRLVSPIRVEGKSLRLRFEAANADEPLTLVPRLGKKGDVMIEVAGGDLEMIGGRFESIKAQRSSPNWLIRVTGGNVQLSNCWLQGPYPPTEHFDGVLFWGPAADAAPHETSEAFCRLSNCLLQGGGAMIHAAVPGGHVLVENSALATSGTVFDLELAGPDAAAGTVTVRQSTLWAFGGFFNVSGTSAVGVAQRLPLRLFAAQCMFASPLELVGRERRTALLRCDPALLNEGQVAWYGKDNGYADLFAHFAPSVGDAAPPQAPQRRTAADFDRQWTRLWGPWHERHPLARERLAWRNGDLQANDLKPGDFVLAAESDALTWGPTGGALGADVARLPAAPPDEHRQNDQSRKPIINF